MDSTGFQSEKNTIVALGFRDSCLREVELVAPSDVQRAVRLFHRDGFVVIRDALTSDHAARLRNKCEELADDILRNDKNRLVKAEKII